MWCVANLVADCRASKLETRRRLAAINKNNSHTIFRIENNIGKITSITLN